MDSYRVIGFLRQEQQIDLQALVRWNLEATIYRDQAGQPLLPVTSTQTVQTMSAMVVSTQSGMPLQSHSVTYIASTYPDFYLPRTMNTRLSQTM